MKCYLQCAARKRAARGALVHVPERNPTVVAAGRQPINATDGQEVVAWVKRQCFYGTPIDRIGYDECRLTLSDIPQPHIGAGASTGREQRAIRCEGNGSDRRVLTFEDCLLAAGGNVPKAQARVGAAAG